MLILARKEALYKKFNINPKNVKCTTYGIINHDNDRVRGVDLEIIPLRINIRCHMSKSITFNFKRCLKMVRCISDQYNVDNGK
jgi:hypothetical protein